MKKLLLGAFVLVSVSCILGVDLSTVPSVESLKCFRTQQHTFVIGRGYKSYGAFDSNIHQTLKNSLEAGFSQNQLGVYMFPCYSETKTAQVQANELISNLTSDHYSSIWIDMQTNPSPNCGWSKNFDLNCEFTLRLVNAVEKSGKKVGIYASNYMWNQIMGGADRCNKFMSNPLWYAHYDGIANFSDFKPFGGWTKPYAKQFKGTTAFCNASVDLNYIA